MDGTISTHDPLALAIALRDDLVISQRAFSGQQYYVIEDPLREKFFRLGSAEYAFVQLLDGHRTVAAAVGQAASQLGDEAFTRDEALRVIAWLGEAGLLQNNARGTQVGAHDAPVPRTRRSLAKWLAPRISLGNPDRYLDQAAPLARLLFTRRALMVWCCWWAVAAFAAVQYDAQLFPAMVEVLRPSNWGALLLTWLGLKLIHELGHGLACKAFGVPVRDAGVSLLLLAPVAYVDVTPVWRLTSRWQRIAVSAAGVYFEGFVAAGALLVCAVTGPSACSDVAQQVFWMASLHTLLVNANPLVRFDGYFALADFLDLPNLHSVGRQWLASAIKRILGDTDPGAPPLAGKLRWLVPTYTLAALAWRTLLFCSIALLLYSWHASLGQVVTWGMILAWLAVPLAQCSAFCVSLVRSTRPSSYRLAGAGALSFAMVVATCWTLAQDASLQAAGVVEYAPLTVVRVGTAGFVCAVRVKDGETVEPGQVLLTLSNDDLLLEAEDLRCQMRISELLVRSFASRQELSEQANEETKCAAFAERLRELDAQIEELTVRAPCAGRILSRQLGNLVGCHLTVGTEVGVIGSEDAKEVIVAVTQGDVDAWPSAPGEPVRLRLASAGAAPAGAAWGGTEPAATWELPHAALSAAYGGPLAIQLAPVAAEGDDIQKRSVHPIFKGTVQLDAEASRRLPAGRLIAVEYVTERRSRAASLLDQLLRRLRDTVAPPAGKA